MRFSPPLAGAITKLPIWVEKRRKYAAMLTSVSPNLPGLRVTLPPEHIGHAYYKYYAFVCPEALRPGWNRDRIIEAMMPRVFRVSLGVAAKSIWKRRFLSLASEERLAVAHSWGRRA